MMTETLTKYLACFRLNARVLSLAMQNRWLSAIHVADSYDKLAEFYDEQWLVHLKPVTDKLLGNLPKRGLDRILDLGCGTGYTIRFLETNYPNSEVVGVDISPGMLKIARRLCNQATLVQADILDYLRHQPDGSVDMVLSGWAIGYSKPEKVIRECRRVLRNNGVLAFVVNFADTLKPVFHAFRKCMQRYPDKVACALWPDFPRNRVQVQHWLTKHQFETHWFEEGTIAVRTTKQIRHQENLPWLLETGVIAGFDNVLPLKHDREMAAYFEQTLKACNQPIEHHYISTTTVVKK